MWHRARRGRGVVSQFLVCQGLALRCPCFRSSSVITTFHHSKALSVHNSFVLSGDFKDSVSSQEAQRTLTYFVSSSIVSCPPNGHPITLSFSFSLSPFLSRSSIDLIECETRKGLPTAVSLQAIKRKEQGCLVPRWEWGAQVPSGQALNTVLPNTQAGQVSEQVGRPRAHAERDTWRLVDIITPS